MQLGKSTLTIALGLVAASLLSVSSSWAKSRSVGATWINRPLVLPKGVVRLDAGPRRPFGGGQVMSAGQLQFHLVSGADDPAYLVPGAGFGLTEDLEVGVVWPLRFAPDLDLADISLYGRYRLQNGPVQLAGFGELRIPIESQLALTAGLPAQIQLSPTLRLDTGAMLRVEFAAEPFGVLNVPAALLVQLTSQWGLGVETGVEVVDFDRLKLPFGLVGVYSIPDGLGSLGDVFGRVGIDDIGSGVDYFRIDIGAELYWDL